MLLETWRCKTSLLLCCFKSVLSRPSDSDDFLLSHFLVLLPQPRPQLNIYLSKPQTKSLKDADDPEVKTQSNVVRLVCLKIISKTLFEAYPAHASQFDMDSRRTAIFLKLFKKFVSMPHVLAFSPIFRSHMGFIVSKQRVYPVQVQNDEGVLLSCLPI